MYSSRTQRFRGVRGNRSFFYRRGGRGGIQSGAAESIILGPRLQSISLRDFDPVLVDVGDCQITDCKLLASYNWLDNGTATIVTPGMPPRWSPLSQPIELKRDHGTYYRDPNAAKYPAHPLEPAILAILATNPDPLDRIDIFGCGSTLRNLLEFVKGESNTFQMAVEVVGKTVHFLRQHSSPTEIIPNVRGYGHTFPEAYTNWDASVKGSSTHQRVIHYTLGGMKIAVRFEGDGYLPSKASNIKANKSAPETGLEGRDADQDLSASLASLSALSSANSFNSNSRLQVSSAGNVVCQSAVFELKTRSQKRKPDEEQIIAEQLPRLWVRQIPNFILAYHEESVFRDIQVRDMRKDLLEWESNQQETIQNLILVLRKIVEFARARKDGKLVATFDEGEDVLVLREQMPNAPETFSEGVRQKWEKWLEGESQVGRESEKLKDIKDDETSVHEEGSKFTVTEALRQAMLEGPEGEESCDDSDSYNDWPQYQDAEDFAACDQECGYCGRCMY